MKPSNIPKIIGIGRNYVAHAKELNNKVPTTPMFFLKPFSSVIYLGDAIRLPKGVGEVHHEVELGVVIGAGGSNIKAKDWYKHVAGYICALDMTARDLQDAAKKSGTPWSLAKGYDTFCPVSTMIDARSIPDPHELDIYLKIDGTLKQSSNTSKMIFKIPTLIEYLSSIMTLCEGDLILTGTPEGVGPVKVGQTLTAGISGPSGNLEFAVTVE